MLNHVPLFTGINGFGLAAEWMGWNQPFHCEIDEFCQKIIQYYWPNSIPYYDIKKTDFTKHRGTVDVLSGGFPCQPYSTAGKRKGTEDDRHLWPEMLRAIREIKPKWVVGENVPGLIGWNRGLVFEEVQTDLETEGYEVFAVLLPAVAKDAPHKRERVWFIAHNNKQYGDISGFRASKVSQFEASGIRKNIVADSHNNGPHGTENGQSYREGNDNNKAGKNSIKQFEGCGSKAVTSNTNSKRGCSGNDRRKNAKYDNARSEAFGFRGNFERWPTQSPLCFRDDGISTKLDGITFPKFRNESIKGAGNAIVPQVAFEIFKIIDQLTLDSY